MSRLARAAQRLSPLWRRRLMGVATLFGGSEQGFFIPHRYAHGAKPCTYPGLEPIFRRSEEVMRGVIAQIDVHAEALLTVGGEPPAPRFGQGWFPRADAAAAYALIRTRKPKRIIEVGSGHSTRFMAEAVRDERLSTTILCIDPDPRVSLEGLDVDHIPDVVQSVDPYYFRALRAGDVLFIDSSHVAMPGTDVDVLFADVLPRLPKGVLVHIHDITLPDPYPPAWGWRAYNEQLAVACLLQGGYQLIWSSHWVTTRHSKTWVRQSVLNQLPLFEGAPETSVWLEKR